MENIKQELELLGLPSDKLFTLKDVKRAFRKRSHALLPEKALANQNAHSRFEHLNTAFLKIIRQKETEGENIDDIIPGEVNLSKVQMVMSLRQGSVPAWKRIIKLTYPTVIVGAQKKNNYIAGATGKAIRYVIYWKAGGEGQGHGQPVKVNLILYENNLLQVSGSGFFIWTMDCYSEMQKRVDNSTDDRPRPDRQESLEREEESESSTEDSQIEVQEDSVEEVKICDAEEKFDKILHQIEVIEGTFANNYEDITDKVKNIESGCNRKLQHAFKTIIVQEKQCYARNIKLQTVLDLMNKRVCDARQIVGAHNMARGKAPSKVSNDEKMKQIGGTYVSIQ